MAKNILSLLLTQYASVIIGGERSFNMRDMRDTLSLVFVPLSFHLHHLYLSTSIRPQPTRVNKAWSPSSLLRDMGPNQNLKTQTPLHLPLPFPEGCGCLKFARWRNGGGGNTRGDPGCGRPK